MKSFKYFFLILVISPFILTAQKESGNPELITVAEFGKSMAIGLSVTPNGRLFVSFPNYNGDGYMAVAEVKDGKLSPYPDRKWNERRSYDSSFLRVQDLFVDADDNLWVLDSKPSPSGNIFRDDTDGNTGKFKLVCINTRTDRVVKVFQFGDLDKMHSALNDVRIDTQKDFAYLSDPGLKGIVVLNLKTGASTVRFKDSKYTTADDIILKYEGQEMINASGKPFSSAVNGIALTHDFRYLYFKPINKQNLFRIKTAYLTDKSKTDKELLEKVEDVGSVGVTHGLIADKKGNIYLTTSEKYAITYLTPGGQLKTLVKDKNILWPDSMGIDGNGYLYFTCAQLQLLPQWNSGTDRTEYPYRAYKVKMLSVTP